MSGRQTGKKRRKGEDEAALYVYCIGEREALAQSPADEALPEPIEPGTQLEVVVGDTLAAIISVVPLKDYGEDSLPERIADPKWLTERAMRHEKVAEHFAERTEIVPLRFGTIYLQRERIERMLADNSTQLRAILARLSGRQEWGLNIYLESARLAESIESHNPRLRAAREQAEQASPGQAYLLRKRLDVMRADESRAEIRRVVSEIEEAMSATSDEAKTLRPLKNETTEYGELVARFAFLVARGRFQEFRDAAEASAERYGASGFRLELTGPWPAYNFTDGQFTES